VRVRWELLGQQPKVFHASRAHRIHGLHYVSIFRTGIRTNVDGFIEAAGDHGLHLIGDLVEADLLVSEVGNTNMMSAIGMTFIAAITGGALGL
jgi:hypothetical protein